MLRALFRAFGYLPLLRCCELGCFGYPRDSDRNVEKWLEIAESFDFGLTYHLNLDNLEKFAQKRHSLLSGSRKPKLNSSGILSLAPGGKK